MAQSIGAVIIDAWDEVMRTTEDPLRRPNYLFTEFGQHGRPSYREELDRVRLNHYGEPIPRIEIVRRNLREFKAGNTMVWRGLAVDRRQRGDRRKHA